MTGVVLKPALLADAAHTRHGRSSPPNFILTAISFCIIFGEILPRSGIAGRMYTALVPWLSWLPGERMHSNVGCLRPVRFGTWIELATAARSVSFPAHSDSMISPLFAITLFVIHSIRGPARYQTWRRARRRFAISLLATIILICIYPDTVMILPRLFG